MSTGIKFRTKFSPFLVREEAFWREKFAEFLKLSAENAIRMLFSLHMRKEETIAKKAPASLDFEQWLGRMPLSSMSFEDACTKLANELTHQYRQNTDKDFLHRDIPDDSLAPIFIKLKESSNEAVAVEVLDRCTAYVTNISHDFARALSLLKHSDEKYYFGGLREIGFTPEEAASLKRHHLLVAEMFEKISAKKEGELPTATELKFPHPTRANPSKPDRLSSKEPAAVKDSHESTPETAATLPLKFVIENFQVLKELNDYPLLIVLLSRENMDIQELFNFLGQLVNGNKLSTGIIQFLANNYDVLKGHTTASIEEAMAKANDPTTLKAALLAAWGNK